MESILIHPENAEQLKAVKAVLKALKIQFESQTQSAKFPPHVVAGIERSLQQAEAGQTISLQEFKERHFSKK